MKITLHKSKMGERFDYALAELRDISQKFGKAGRRYGPDFGVWSRTGSFVRVTGHADSAESIGSCDGTPAQEKDLLERHFGRPIMSCRTLRREDTPHGFLEVTFLPEREQRDPLSAKKDAARLARLAAYAAKGELCT